MAGKGCLRYLTYNNAGVNSLMCDTADDDPEEYDRVMDIDLRGQWLCMKYELQEIRKKNDGAIVNCSSLGGLVGNPGRAAYHARERNSKRRSILSQAECWTRISM